LNLNEIPTLKFDKISPQLPTIILWLVLKIFYFLNLLNSYQKNWLNILMNDHHLSIPKLKKRKKKREKWPVVLNSTFYFILQKWRTFFIRHNLHILETCLAGISHIKSQIITENSTPKKLFAC
jgi:hypothetical protein